MKRWIFALASLISIVALTVVFPTVASGQDLSSGKKINIPGPKYAPGEVMVRFRPGIAESSRYFAHGQVQAQVIKRFKTAPPLELVRLPKGMSVEEGVTRYSRNPNVFYAYPNFIYHSSVAPDDTLFPDQWNLNNTGTSGADIDAPEAWDLTTGSHDVVVAVIDSGIDYTHPDLTGNMFRNEEDCNTNGIDDDGNGYIDDCYGIDPASGDSDPMDDFQADDVWHGTGVAGVIGAMGNNAFGISGVNWNVSLLACKDGVNGQISAQAMLDCLEYIRDMKDNQVNIVAVNLSQGNYWPSPVLRDAIDELRQRGIIFVSSAGNEDFDADTLLPSYPASFFLPNIISVTGTTSSDSQDYDFGRHTVHLGAPGRDIWTTKHALLPSDELFHALNGTSFAAPHVAGVAALLKAFDSSLNWKQIKNRILAGGDSISSLANKTVTGKRLNAHGALTCSNSPVISRVLPRAQTVGTTPGDPVVLAALNINCGVPNGNVQVSADPGGGSITLLDNGVAPDQEAGDGIYTGQFIPSALGTYTITFPGDDVVSVRALRDYQPSVVDFQYRDFTGTYINFPDSGVWIDTTFGFSLQFGGQSFSHVTFSSDGTVMLGQIGNTSAVQFLNRPIPHPENSPILVAPFWDDLYPDYNSPRNVYATVLGTAPNRELVIEWRDVHYYNYLVQGLREGCTSTGGVTLQVVFSESKDDVLFNYKDVSFGGDCAFADSGGSATVGIQIGRNTGSMYSFNAPNLTDNMSILWTTESLSVSPSSLDFGGVVVGETSDPKTVTLSNESGSTITISNVAASGDFAVQSDQCTGSLAANNTCTIGVTFTPTDAGTRNGELTFNSSPGGEQRISLVGSGAVPVVVLSPPSVDFGQQGTNSASDPKDVTLKNDGGATLSITDISTDDAEFTADGSKCGTSLDAGQECTITVTFEPSAEKPFTSYLRVTTNAPTSPDTVSLSGEGVPVPLISLSATSLPFGQQQVDGSVTQSVDLTNTGTATLNVTNIQTDKDPPFAASKDCVGNVAPSNSCTIQVTFTPSAVQTYSGTLTIDSNADNSPHEVVALTGEGQTSALSMDHSTLDFAKQLMGAADHQTRSVRLTNSGGIALKIKDSTITGEHAGHFERNDADCTSRSSIAPQQSCQIDVTFNPTSTGAKNATLLVTSDDPESPHSIGLTGQSTDFSVGMAQGASDSATLTAGQAATYNLSVGPVEGFEGSTALTCKWNTPQPRGTACSVTPATVSVNGPDPASATVTITTTARSMAPVGWDPQPPAPTNYPVSHLAIWLLGLAALACLALRRRRATVILASVLFMVVLWAACGGDGNNNGIIDHGTPAGTSTLTVTGTSSGMSHSTDLTLIVK